MTERIKKKKGFTHETLALKHRMANDGTFTLPLHTLIGKIK